MYFCLLEIKAVKILTRKSLKTTGLFGGPPPKERLTWGEDKGPLSKEAQPAVLGGSQKELHAVMSRHK